MLVCLCELAAATMPCLLLKQMLPLRLPHSHFAAPLAAAPGPVLPADDVRHMRNRRGWMPYHIAMHKGFENLAELLHPDIP